MVHLPILVVLYGMHIIKNDVSSGHGMIGILTVMEEVTHQLEIRLSNLHWNASSSCSCCASSSSKGRVGNLPTSVSKHLTEIVNPITVSKTKLVQGVHALNIGNECSHSRTNAHMSKGSMESNKVSHINQRLRKGKSLLVV